jgi:hypothetical protein
MLTAMELREYCHRLGFPGSTVGLIQKIRTSPPSRRVASDLDNVSGN